jgi:hypothetical protein
MFFLVALFVIAASAEKLLNDPPFVVVVHNEYFVRVTNCADQDKVSLFFQLKLHSNLFPVHRHHESPQKGGEDRLCSPTRRGRYLRHDGGNVALAFRRTGPARAHDQVFSPFLYIFNKN